METSVASSNNTNMAEQKLPETIGEGEAGEGELMKSPVATSKPYDVNTSSSGNFPQVTPTRVSSGGRVGKRKLQTTTTLSPLHHEGDEKPSVPKKRRSSSMSSTGGGGISSSPNSSFKPQLTERQQLALLKQLTESSPGSLSVVGGSPSSDVSPRDTPTGRSRIHRRNERGETPLHLACIKGDKSTVLSLINQGADANTTDNAGWTPLHEACNHGHLDIVSILIDNDVSVNARGMDGDTPLHDAVINNHTEVVSLLIRKGADPLAQNDKSKSPLDICRDDEIRVLLKMGGAYSGEHTNGDEVFEKKNETKNEPSVDKSPHPLFITQTPPNLTSWVRKENGRPSETTPLSSKVSSHKESEKRKKNSRGSFHSDVSSSESDGEGAESVGIRPHPSKLMKLISTEDEIINEKIDKTNHSTEVRQKEEEKECLQEDKPHPSEERPHLSEEIPHLSEERPHPSEEKLCLLEERLYSLGEGININNEEVCDKEELKEKNSCEEMELTIPTVASSSSQLEKEEIVNHHTIDSINKQPLANDDNSERLSTFNDTQQSDTQPIQGEGEMEKELITKIENTSIPIVIEQRTVALPSLQENNNNTVQQCKEKEITPLVLPLTTKDSDLLSEEPLNNKATPTLQSETTPTLKSKAMPTLQRETTPTLQANDMTSSQNVSLLVSFPRSIIHVPSNPTTPLSDICSDNILSPSDSCSVSIMSGCVQRVTSIDDEISTSLITPIEDHAPLITTSNDYNDEDSCSTVVSFSTSLPLVFSSRSSQTPTGSRSVSPTTPTLSSLVSSFKSRNEKDVAAMETSKTETFPLKSPPFGKVKSPPISKPVKSPPISKPVKSPPLSKAIKSPPISKAIKSPPTFNDFDKSSKSDGGSSIKPPPQSLPIKKRIMKQVYKSPIIEQRKALSLTPLPPSLPPHNYDTFLLSTQSYSSRSLPSPYEPQSVYPPISVSLYEMFVDQEEERLRLLASHLTEIDRLMISFEQEILRAHNKTTPLATPPLSMCGVLMEQFLLVGKGNKQNNKTENRVESEMGVANKDERLLSGYVQDVWDKFHRECLLLAGRHKDEIETLWIVQLHQWVTKVKEITGRDVSTNEIPSSHVPVTHCGPFPHYVH